MGWIFFALGLGLVYFLIRDNTRRSRRSIEFQLIPNCLLSKNPLLFIDGKKSLVYSLQYWGLVPSYLQQHGYEVHELDLPWRKDLQREFALTEFLKAQEQQGRRFHLFFDASSRPLIRDVFAKQTFDSVASITLIAPTKTQISGQGLKPLRQAFEVLPMDFKKNSWVWRLHCLWTGQKIPDARFHFEFNQKTNAFFETFLAQSMKLAEKDFADAPSSGEPHHEQHAERPPGDFLRFAELP
jgi:hypothetical protein